MLNVEAIDADVSRAWPEMEFIAHLVMTYLSIAFRAGVILASECLISFATSMVAIFDFNGGGRLRRENNLCQGGE